MAIPMTGEWKSAEVVYWSFEAETDEQLQVISNYRHILMDRFVELIKQTYGEDIVVSTRISTSKSDTKGYYDTFFEFSLTPEGIHPGYIADLSFERIVHRLLTAVQKENALAEAEREVRRNTF